MTTFSTEDWSAAGPAAPEQLLASITIHRKWECAPPAPEQPTGGRRSRQAAISGRETLRYRLNTTMYINRITTESKVMLANAMVEKKFIYSGQEKGSDFIVFYALARKGARVC
jgi:hypothetical protein